MGSRYGLGRRCADHIFLSLDLRISWLRCDPIDGTKGFVRGDQYAVCLALLDQGRPLLSVIGCPNMLVDPKDPNGPKGVLFVAKKGHGAYMVSPQPLPSFISSIAD